MENIETLLAAVAQTQGFDDDEPVVSTESTLRLENSVSSQKIQEEVGGSEPVGPHQEVSGDARPSSVNLLPTVVPAVDQVIGAAEKKKRGRPPKGQLAAKPPPPKRKRQEDEEEDVCFICFDGGSLVLCDRKGCPKAYHPACIKRDEAFFRSKAKWNCGWHICTVCQKASHYMCYTCPFSLCKGCTKDSDYMRVRGNKGFCTTCMKTIMLIENKDQANNDLIQVDFDDQTSWEYLFKWYWVLLKEKLSLTMSELAQAKKPWKGPTPVVCKPQLRNLHHSAPDGKVSIPNRSSDRLELNKPPEEISLPQYDGLKTAASSTDNHMEKLSSDWGECGPGHSKDIKNDNNMDAPDIEGTCEPGVKNATYKPIIKEGGDNPSIVKDINEPRDKGPDKSVIDNHAEWASKALLEFVGHMKNGDTSALSELDVQALLFDYIKRKNLEDPIQKSQIICDLRLRNLFGKPCVDHIEMLKLLKSHFLIKADSQKNSFIQAGFVGSVASNMEVDRNNSGQVMCKNGRKRKTIRKSEEKEPHNNLSQYAAIDVHNVNLIYLPRKLLENLNQAKDSFHDKVVGSIVRIRISSDDQKPDIYRLVKVVGTSKVSEPYKVGDRTADIMLEVLNLDKKEVVSIDTVSNQEFTEEECRQLYQSIRCGLLKQFTVGELQKKAMALQAVRLNDLLEAEILLLNHLRDQAIQKGHRNDLREHVRKLQLLRSPGERQRRISEVPEIHADPEISPNYEAEETRSSDNIRKDEHEGLRYSEFPQNGKKPLSPNKEGVEGGSIQARDRAREKVDARVSPSVEQCMNQDNTSDLAIGGRSNQAMGRSALETSTATVSMGNSLTDNNIETEKLWHYRDPNGKIQGPFSMMHLRQSSTTGLFPPDMRIWTNHELFDSLLLTDALNGKYHGAAETSHNPDSQEHRASGGTGGCKAIDMNDGVGKQTEQPSHTDANVLSDNNSGSLKADESSWPQCWDFLTDNNSRGTGDVVPRSLLPSSSLGQAQESVELNRAPQTTEENSSGPTQNETASEHKLENKLTSQGQAGQSAEENLRSLPIDLSLNDMESGSVLAPVSRPPDSIKQDGAVDVSDLLSPTLKTRTNQLGVQPVSRPPDSNKQDGAVDVSDLLSPTLKTRTDQWGVQTVSRPPDSIKEDGAVDVSDLLSPTLKTRTDQWGVQTAASNVATQTSGILELLSLTPRSNNEDQARQTTETKQSGLVNLPEPNSGPSWNGASNLMGVRLQLPEVTDDWCKYSPAPAKPSGQEWDPGLVTASSKPPEIMTDNVANSDSNQLTHVSPSHPAPNITNWLAMLNEPIEFDALGEESVSDLLAEVDAMESQGGLPSPTSAMKFAKELIQDCKDDCFSSIDEFDPGKSGDALSSTGEIQLNCHSSAPCKPAGPSPIDGLDSINRSGVHSCGSSAGETNAPVYQTEAGSDFHPPAANNTNQDMVGAATAPGMGSEATDPGWGTVQGNINLVTVQGNVNLVLGGPAQGMANLGWGTNPGTAWANPNLNHSPISAGLPWDGQRKYGGDRFPSPRDWGYQGDPGFGRGRPPWGRPYNSRPLPKGQRVCKFYESGRCKKGAFCDYLHP